MNRFNLHKIFICGSVMSAAISFVITDPQLGGLALAGGGVFFALFMMFNFLKNEKTDEELAEEALHAKKVSAEVAPLPRPAGRARRLIVQNAHNS